MFHGPGGTARELVQGLSECGCIMLIFLEEARGNPNSPGAGPPPAAGGEALPSASPMNIDKGRGSGGASIKKAGTKGFLPPQKQTS